jgi:hypothetical protein
MVKKLAPIARMLWSGLFLDVDAYDEASDADNPFVEGLFIIVLIGILVALASIIGSILGWGITPDLAQIKALVHDGLVSMPWYQQFLQGNADAVRQFEHNYDLSWRIARFFAPNPSRALLSLFISPLSLFLQWLWFALIAQAVARILGGQGRMGQTFGATALAFAPHLLYVFRALPMVSVAAVGVWTLLAKYVAIRRVHENLSWQRVVVAVLAPPILFWFLVILLTVLGLALMGTLIGGMVS